MKMTWDRNGQTSGIAALLVVCALHTVFSLITFTLAKAIGSPFILWFEDTFALLATLLAGLVLLGILWDGSLITIGLAAQTLSERLPLWAVRLPSVESMRPKRFFSCGAAPMVLILATALSILGTSNITLINIELLSNTSRYRDPLLWEIEGPVLELLAGFRFSPQGWDRLYHGAWLIEILAAFALVVIGRGTRIVLHYCMTMIVLFYLGRLVGLLTPVMGPAFFRPEFFGHLEGSFSAIAMQQVGALMQLSAEQAAASGGILLGGISAMPSLHVGMVSVTAYWLAMAHPRTLLVTTPWVAAVWFSTVLLGWHYILDGAGGILLAATSIALTNVLLRALPMTSVTGHPSTCD